MLVSVTERTREIGIRLAIGALEGQVLMQLLVEAVVLSGLGGLIGIMLGLSLAGLATRALDVPFVLDLTIVLIAFAFSALVGVAFGYFPARAARPTLTPLKRCGTSSKARRQRRTLAVEGGFDIYDLQGAFRRPPGTSYVWTAVTSTTSSRLTRSSEVRRSRIRKVVGVQDCMAQCVASSRDQYGVPSYRT
jgi:hypothetical protein